MKTTSIVLIALASAAATTLPTTTTESSSTPQDAAAYSAVAASVESFTTSLYQVVRSVPGNLVISPLSAAVVLALTWIGSGGQTEQQLGDALHLPPDHQLVADGYRQLMDSLQSNDIHMLLSIANKLYLQTGFGLRASFRETAVDDFRAGVEELNFLNDSENSRLAINQWVEESTNGKIVDLLPPDSITSDTIFVLVNAIYFRANWTYKFPKEATTTELFYESGSRQTNVSMMNGRFSVRHGRVPGLCASAIVLPYNTNDFQAEMLIILPDDINGLANVENGLSGLDISTIPLTQKIVEVALPKFTIETTENLNQDLELLGVIDLFQSDANLTGIAEERLYVTDVIQKAYIKVDESGTEAAAATAVIGARITAVIVQEVTVFRADHPFLFFLRTNDVTLFVGRVASPTE